MKFITAIVLFQTISAHNVHQGSGSPRRTAFLQSSSDLRNGLRDAVAAALGEGHGVQQLHLQALRHKIKVAWRSLPTNDGNRVDRRTLRYVVHRHFMQEHHLSIVGLEPAQVNSSHEEAALLTEFVPSYVRSSLEGSVVDTGFSIEDAVVMVATIERLLVDANKMILEKSYEAASADTTSALNHSAALAVLEKYVLVWMVGTDDIAEYEEEDEQPHEDWDQIEAFVEGQLRHYEYARSAKMHARKPGDLKKWTSFRPQYSFADLETIANGMTMTFGRFWQTECERVQNLLTKMDRRGNGRVSLSDFYAAAMDGEWRFSESKEYLRQLGALDETSWMGPQVIITNYMQGPSNCIVSTPHYRVCCANECEGILDAVEEELGTPMAPPDAIIAVLSNFSVHEDSTLQMTSSLAQQLADIGRSNHGTIPLHGRLFAQWLHYAFPQSCAFPHKMGTTTALTPLEFGNEHLVSDEEMEAFAMGRNNLQPSQDDEDWMSQWSHEEELLSDQMRLQAPWERNLCCNMLVIITIAIGIAFAISWKAEIQTNAKKSAYSEQSFIKNIHMC